MDGFRFDALTRSLTASGSRRRALAAALGGAFGMTLGATSVVEGVKKKKPCPPCKKRNKKGRCKKKKPDGTSCASGTCQGGRCVPPCPSVCPVCQACQTRTGECTVQTSQNGQAGQDCATPKVCCSGVCCPGDGVQACNTAGACATCAEVCPDTCGSCINLADGGTKCGDGGSGVCVACSSAADCTDPDRPDCVLSITDRSSNQTEQLAPICGFSPGTAVCFRINDCA